MALQIKIQGATPTGGKSICLSCKHAKVIIGQNCEQRIICGAHGLWTRDGVVKFRVSQCTSYHPMNMPWRHEMEEMAWIVQARKRGPTGFQPDNPNEMIVTIEPPQKSDETAPGR